MKDKNIHLHSETLIKYVEHLGVPPQTVSFTKPDTGYHYNWSTMWVYIPFNFIFARVSSDSFHTWCVDASYQVEGPYCLCRTIVVQRLQKLFLASVLSKILWIECNETSVLSCFLVQKKVIVKVALHGFT